MFRCKGKYLIRRKVRFTWITLVLGGVCLYTTGCENKKTTDDKLSTQQKVEVRINADNLNDIEKMERCRRELNALKKIDSSIYNKRKLEFDKLISGATLYNGVRNDVGNYTQSAVDALYRFRADKLCADISADVLELLSDK